MFILTLFILNNNNGLIPEIPPFICVYALVYFVKKVEFYFCDSSI